MLPYKHLHVFHKREILKQKKDITALRSEIPLKRKSEESSSPRLRRLHRERFNDLLEEAALSSFGKAALQPWNKTFPPDGKLVQPTARAAKIYRRQDARLRRILR